MKLNWTGFILILPVALSWLVVDPDGVQLVFVSLLVMAGAEAIRQYFSASAVRDTSAPRQLFFFGVVYKDNKSFLANKNTVLPGLSRSNKVVLLAAVYILTLSLKFSSAFENLNFIHSAFFSLVITLWVYCGTYRKLSRVLLLQMTGTCVAFAAADDANGIIFLLWLVLSLWAQLQAHTWTWAEDSRRAEFNALTTSASFFKSVVAAFAFIMCFRAAELLIPEYGEARPSATAGEPSAAESNNSPAPRKKELRVPKKFVSNLAKYKLQAGAIDFSRLNAKDIKVPSGSIGSMFKLPGLKLGFGEHRRELEDIRNNLLADRPVNSGDLDKLGEIARKIKLPPSSGDGSHPAEYPEIKSDGSSPDQTDQIIQDRIEKLKGQVKQQNQSEDDAAAYAKSRRQLADDIDKMLEQDQKNTLAKEELSLQKFFDRLLLFLKRFSLLIGLCLLAAWWLRKKTVLKKAESTPEISFELPKEVRIQLKQLYKLLLKGTYSPKDEVIRSYHLVDLAFKEFDFARKEDLPPSVFLDRLRGAMPGVSKSAEVPTELFCRVFYGDKNPVEKEIGELRTHMRELMKKLRVI